MTDPKPPTLQERLRTSRAISDNGEEWSLDPVAAALDKAESRLREVERERDGWRNSMRGMVAEVGEDENLAMNPLAAREALRRYRRRATRAEAELKRLREVVALARIYRESHPCRYAMFQCAHEDEFDAALRALDQSPSEEGK